MARYGVFNPQESENTSTLFSYQEVPLTSSKMNHWNGNITAALTLLHEVCSALFAKGANAVITISDDSPLGVLPSTPPAMTVSVYPGWAILGNSLAGVEETQTVPAGSTIPAPTTNPRIDLVILKSTGELALVEGTEAASPIPPDTPEDAIALARIYLRVGSTKILPDDDDVESYIIDAREKFMLGEAHQHASDRTPPEEPNGTLQQFTTQHIYRGGSLSVYLNGVLQERDLDYTEDEGVNSYTFTTAPLSNYRIQHRYIIDREMTS